MDSEQSCIQPAPVGALLLALAVVIFIQSQPMDLNCDDAYITFRYSENLVKGHGLVFNLGERVYGLTSPLYALLLSGLMSTGLPVAGAARLVAIASALGLLLVGVRLGRVVFSDPIAGLIGSFFLLTLPPVAVLGLFGMESILFLFMIAAGFSLLDDRPWASMVVLGLSLGVRIEAVVALLVASAHAVFFRRGKERLLVPGIAITAVMVYCVAGYVYYGSPVPLSLLSKVDKPSSLTGSFIVLKTFAAISMGFVPGLEPPLFNPGMALPVMAAFFLLGKGRVQQKRWLPLICFCVLYALAYILSGKEYAQYFVWYFVPPLLGVCLLAGAWISGVASRLAASISIKWGRAVVAILVIIVWMALSAFPLRVKFGYIAESRNFRERVYAAAAIWLRENAPPRSVVAGPEIGVLGYFSELPILDTFGLVSKRSGHRDPFEVLEEGRPDYIVAMYFFEEASRGKGILEGYQWMHWRSIWIAAKMGLPLPEAARLESIYLGKLDGQGDSAGQ